MISSDDYRFVSELLKRCSGLSLGEGKGYLVESRLPSVATAFGYADVTQLITALRLAPTPALVKATCDSMATGETLFFRDGAPFVALREVLLPAAVARARLQGRGVRIWCAACSTGQEAYSVAMTVEQARPEIGAIDVEIFATDFSTTALARAREGIYNQFEVQRGLPVQLLVRFFRQHAQGFQVHPELRAHVCFAEQNLLRPFAENGLFDIIFIRNVLIYFDPPTKREVLERMARQLHTGGVIMLGGTENTLGVTECLERQSGFQLPVYRRKGDPSSALLAAPQVA